MRLPPLPVLRAFCAGTLRVDTLRASAARASAVLVGAVLLGAACSAGGPAPGPTPSPDKPPQTSARAELASRAAAAKDLVGVSFYRLVTPGADDRTVMVVRAADGGWRVDIPGGALGGSVDVAIADPGDGLHHCVLPSETGPDPGCVRVEQLTADIDPRIHRVFTDWREVQTDRTAAVAVAAAEPPAEVTGACYAVEPSAASLVDPLDAGVYCYDVDGTLTGAELALGTLTLTGTGDAAPETIDLPGPVTDREPLPTDSPSPPPPPSPAPDEPPTPAEPPTQEEESEPDPS